jgi:hypothetical protein
MTRTPAPKLAAKAKKPKKAPAGEVVHAVKGFDKDLKCLGFQYEIGKTYEHGGPVHLCASGFHSIDGNPLDVLDFYPLIADDGSLNRFASVVASGEIKRDDSSKICSARIAVGAELKIPDLIASAVKFVIGACKGTSGDLVQAASGYSSQLAASGHYSQLAASGHYSQLAASGDYSQLAASGNSSKLAASGHYSQLAASGHYSQLAASGYSSQLAASGDYSQLAASGHSSKLAASGRSSKLAASGDSSQMAASGPSSQLAASGDSSKMAASGPSSKLAASGHSSKLEIKGAKSAAAAVGPNSIVRAIARTPIAICEYDRNGNPVGFVCGVAGEEGCPADTWLKAENGKFVEAK